MLDTTQLTAEVLTSTTHSCAVNCHPLFPIVTTTNCAIFCYQLVALLCDVQSGRKLPSSRRNMLPPFSMSFLVKLETANTSKMLANIHHSTGHHIHCDNLKSRNSCHAKQQNGTAVIIRAHHNNLLSHITTVYEALACYTQNVPPTFAGFF